MIKWEYLFYPNFKFSSDFDGSKMMEFIGNYARIFVLDPIIAVFSNSILIKIYSRLSYINTLVEISIHRKIPEMNII